MCCSAAQASKHDLRSQFVTLNIWACMTPSCTCTHNRDHASVAEGLRHVALYNSAFLLSGDMEVLLQAMATKQQPVYSKL